MEKYHLLMYIIIGILIAVNLGLVIGVIIKSIEKLKCSSDSDKNLSSCTRRSYVATDYTFIVAIMKNESIICTGAITSKRWAIASHRSTRYWNITDARIVKMINGIEYEIIRRIVYEKDYDVTVFFVKINLEFYKKPTVLAGKLYPIRRRRFFLASELCNFLENGYYIAFFHAETLYDKKVCKTFYDKNETLYNARTFCTSSHEGEGCSQYSGVLLFDEEILIGILVQRERRIDAINQPKIYFDAFSLHEWIISVQKDENTMIAEFVDVLSDRIL